MTSSETGQYSTNSEQNPAVEQTFGISLRDEPKSKITCDVTSPDIETSDSAKEDIILCILFQNWKLGAAYFNINDSELYIIEDITDLGPEFILMKNLYIRVKPFHTITIGRMESQFITALNQIAQTGTDGDSISTLESRKTFPPNLQLLKMKEYSYESCLHAVKTLSLLGEPENASENERFLYLNTLINFERKVSCHALGALLMFLNKYWGILLKNKQGPEYLNINTTTVKNIVLMDNSTFLALQVFNPISHPANFKRGEMQNNKEGLSLFKLFNRCRSTLGVINLKTMLLQPTNDLEILKKRQQFIQFCLQPANTGIVKGIGDALKKIYELSMTLTKIHGNTAKMCDWKKLYSTLHNILLINQICSPYVQQVKLFEDLTNFITEEIYIIVQTLMQTIDFENTDYLGRITIKYGVDDELDNKKRYSDNLQEKITIAASYEIKNLPPSIKNCSILYMPEIGYLVSIEQPETQLDLQNLQKRGYHYYFTIEDYVHFKSPLCVELDRCLGDVRNEIVAHESRILLRLAISVSSCSAALKKPLKLVAQFDSLISFAEVAREYNYVCPNISEENIINIEDGRHPLLEISLTNYVPNSFISGGQNSRLKVLTGPNASGKSIFLKQIAMIVYLTHVGSFVPAKSATVGLMNSIHTRIRSVESATNEISAFVSSLRQMTQAELCSEKNSLILIDEFGKGTTDLDGLALLASFLKSFLIREELCPHIVTSTHYLHLTNLLPESNLVEHLNPSCSQIENKMVFLYKIVKGVSSSFAFQAALCAGISPDIIERSKEILKIYQRESSA